MRQYLIHPTWLITGPKIAPRPRLIKSSARPAAAISAELQEISFVCAIRRNLAVGLDIRPPNHKGCSVKRIFVKSMPQQHPDDGSRYRTIHRCNPPSGGGRIHAPIRQLDIARIDRDPNKKLAKQKSKSARPSAPPQAPSNRLAHGRNWPGESTPQAQ